MKLRLSNLGLAASLSIVSVVLCLSNVSRGQQGTPAEKSASRVGAGAPDTYKERGFVGDAACKDCHQSEFESYMRTRHHMDSARPSAETIHGHFEPGRNTLASLDPEVSFRMDARDGSFFETSLVGRPGQEKKRTEKIDVVIGSGAKGQTYLYWRGDELFELPVSHWTSLDRWVNSPGYVDGTADFGRGINARCLECHSTYFQEIGGSKSGIHYDKEHFVLGISCERCHGPGSDHVRAHSSPAGAAPVAAAVAKLPPIGIERDRQVDICAQCHGGIGHGLTPAFSFKPGEELAPHISLEANPLARVDVHGNQVALLEKSRCFQESPSMTCSTCHNSHEPERAAAAYSEKCLTCHKASACPTFSKMPAPAVTNCIDCHMPVQASNSLRVDLEDQEVPVEVRNHWIRAYPSSTSPHQN